MNLELIVNSTPVAITQNIAELKAHLEAGLERYDIQVTEEGLKDAKKMATEINGLSNQIDKLRKTKVAELSAPIKELDTQCKQLISLCQNSRQKILSQVNVFEDTRKATCKELLEEELGLQYRRFEVKEEYQTVDISDLAILSNLTKSGIAKKASSAIEDRVLLKKKFQDLVDKRLLELKGKCFEAGLEAPLVRKNIEHFLMDDDDSYEEKLRSLIKVEIQKFNDFHERAQAAIATPAVKITQEEVKPQLKEALQPVQPLQETTQETVKQPVQTSTDTKKKKFVVTATFEVEIAENLEDKIEQMLLKKFHDACFKQIPTISIEEVEEEKTPSLLEKGSLF